ncbi:Multidrug resistance protein MdtN [Vibrio aerogenes CECT 7868]|uniref:Multidrug resistance protein MdtN n=1 Tax=Vibrio aerogenes CECT 7868 TaxID=1216006 RepID=A0A1M6CK51_9VIBR|nr:HlyD family secretion protein [Vibrio aerogenes]SHI61241.1 Multidrug resistance protein MdtN [Vibrio aerogenes CECT 7868]
MTPDQKFARWVKYTCAVFAILFVYFIFADMAVPLTPQSMATRIVTKVAPRLDGQIIQVNVRNNQTVHQGDILFELDPAQYQLAVEQAQLNLDKAIQDFQQLNVQIEASESDVKALLASARQKQREAKRMKRLFAHKSVSQKEQDDAVSAATVAQANLEAAQARLKELVVRRGEDKTENIQIRVAKNRLQQARLNLSYTRVRAKHDGVVTNLQLKNGSMAKAGSPVIALVDTHFDVIADFREKSLRNFPANSKALVTFDGEPGKVYPGVIGDVDAGVSSGQFDANGSLATPTTSNRWVRDAQRLRVHIRLDNPLVQHLAAGSRATVQLVPDNQLLTWLARGQIYFLSLLHYIY